MASNINNLLTLIQEKELFLNTATANYRDELGNKFPTDLNKLIAIYSHIINEKKPLKFVSSALQLKDKFKILEIDPEYAILADSPINKDSLIKATAIGNKLAANFLDNNDLLIVLDYAIQTGNLDTVRYLIDEKNTAYNDSHLIAAIKAGHLPIVRYFIDEKNLPFNNELEGHFDTAFTHGHLHIVKYFVDEKNLSVNDFLPNGLSGSFVYLCHAIISGNLNLVKYLVDENNVDFIDQHVELAIRKKHLNILRYFADEKNYHLNNSAITEAINASCFDIIKYLVDEKNIAVNNSHLKNAQFNFNLLMYAYTIQRNPLTSVENGLNIISFLKERLWKQKIDTITTIAIPILIFCAIIILFSAPTFLISKYLLLPLIQNEMLKLISQVALSGLFCISAYVLIRQFSTFQQRLAKKISNYFCPCFF